MFSKPTTRAIAGPRTASESIARKAAVKKKYPQMSEKDWGKPTKKKRKTAVDTIVEHDQAELDSAKNALSPEEFEKFFGSPKRRK